jgi:hypothetical protein
VKATKPCELKIEKKTFTEREKVGDEIKRYSYDGFALIGWLNGKRVRKQFKTRSEALTEKERLELEAANTEGSAVRPVNTWLSLLQVRAAEVAVERLGGRAIGDVVDFFLANYVPPSVSVPMEIACAEFMRDQEGEVSVSGWFACEKLDGASNLFHGSGAPVGALFHF